MDVDQAILSPRRVALLSDTSEGVGERRGRHVIFNRQQAGRTGVLESRTRTGWPTVKAHGMFKDKERPLSLTAECCIY